MSTRIILLAAAAALFATGSSFAAASPPMQPTHVPQSVIDAGPRPWLSQFNDASDNSTDARAQAELAYLHAVCPTVLSSPGRYRANLVRFCQELPG